MAAYRALLARYHRTLDLMSPQAYADLDRHLAEASRYAAAVAEFAPPGTPIVDLGSGAGLPGVVVAAELAPREVWWVERRRRRTAFLTQVAAHARLDHVRVVGDDVRRLERPPGGVGAVTAQAVGTLVEVATLTRHLWRGRVLLVSRKGPDWAEEVEALTDWWARHGRPAGPDGVSGAPDGDLGDPGGAVGDAPETSDGPMGGEGMRADDLWAPPLVLRAEALGTRGTLVAVELRGG